MHHLQQRNRELAVSDQVKVLQGEAQQYQFPMLGITVFVSPCHHGMAGPQVADGGTASNMDGSCE